MDSLIYQKIQTTPKGLLFIIFLDCSGDPHTMCIGDTLDIIEGPKVFREISIFIRMCLTSFQYNIY